MIKPLQKYLGTLDTWGKRNFATTVGTSPAYLGQLARGERTASAELACTIDEVTEGKVSRMDLCPACHSCRFAQERARGK